MKEMKETKWAGVVAFLPETISCAYSIKLLFLLVKLAFS